MTDPNTGEQYTTPQPVVVAVQPAVAVAQPVTTTTTQVNTTTVQTRVVFGESPVTMTDPNTGEQYTTITRYKAGALTWIIVAVLFFFGFWLCMCIPCCIPACQDVDHFHPRTNALVGTYRRLS